MIIPITDLRRELETMEEGGILLNCEGIKLIEPRNSYKDMLKGFNCIGYCFGQWNIDIFEYIEGDIRTTRYHSEVQEPEKNDLAIYFTDRGGIKEQVHIGRVNDNHLVISKWGYGNVYMHQFELVPASYGNELRFFRKNL